MNDLSRHALSLFSLTWCDRLFLENIENVPYSWVSLHVQTNDHRKVCIRVIWNDHTVLDQPHSVARHCRPLV